MRLDGTVKKKTTEEKILNKLDKIEKTIKKQESVSYFREVGAVVLSFGISFMTISIYFADPLRHAIAGNLFAFAGILYLIQSTTKIKPFEERGKPTFKKIQRFMKNFPLASLGIALMVIAVILIFV